jgi:hypothetical protein
MSCKSSETESSATHSNSNVSSSEIVGKWRFEDEKGNGQTIDIFENNTCTIESDIDLGMGKRFDCKWNVSEDGWIEVLISSRHGIEIKYLEGELEGDSFYTTMIGDHEYEYIRIE